MHGGMQPPEKDGPGLPPPGVRPHQGAPAHWVGPRGHRLCVVSLALGLDLSHGYDHAQFCVVRAFLYFLGLRISESVFWYFALSSWYGTFALVAL